MYQLSAPVIDKYISMLYNGKMKFDEKSWNLIDELFELLNKIKPCGEDNRHELWITAPRGDLKEILLR